MLVLFNSISSLNVEYLKNCYDFKFYNYFQLKKYNLIDDIIRSMIVERSDLDKEERRALFSAWGRIYLQIGDIFGAEQKFAEARRLRKM